MIILRIIYLCHEDPSIQEHIRLAMLDIKQRNFDAGTINTNTSVVNTNTNTSG